ncbi:hypothetical protein A33M_2035 [Rhodovulum sp. PH10]|uniref:alpha/beta hydrolase n=1 Tax=Rhodovulum sp. PH10 TaxID=1187851 RepID=UPI00027C1DE8|nr:alpha/beta fold hydrolase [Rhodovulum sp. PH10]EJW12463.1 hypothetical protein A33M_2035 [Rhodovulum sp. PH10]
MTVLVVAIGGVALYGGVVAAMYVAQRSLMYTRDPRRTPPAEAGLPQADEVFLDTADGERIVAWHVPPRDGRPVLLYLHGNGGTLRQRADRFAGLLADGFGLVAPTYRGFGGSSGTPTEDGLARDAEAAWAFTAARYPPENIVVWGESLGTGVAVRLVGEHPVGRLVLEAAFTSTADVGQRSYPLIPIGLLMKDQFRSIDRAGAITVPTLVMHGAKDGLVPISQAERLFSAIPAPKRFVRFPDGGHDKLDPHGASDAVRDFLATPVEALSGTPTDPSAPPADRATAAE